RPPVVAAAIRAAAAAERVRDVDGDAVPHGHLTRGPAAHVEADVVAQGLAQHAFADLQRPVRAPAVRCALRQREAANPFVDRLLAFAREPDVQPVAGRDLVLGADLDL